MVKKEFLPRNNRRTNVKGSNTSHLTSMSRCMVSCGGGWGLLTSRNVSHVRDGFFVPHHETTESVFHSFPSGQGMDGRVL